MNTLTILRVLFILSIDQKVTQAALPFEEGNSSGNGHDLQEDFVQSVPDFVQANEIREQEINDMQVREDEDVRIHRADFVANEVDITDEISITEAGEDVQAVENANFGEVSELATNLDRVGTTPNPDHDVTTTETNVEDLPLVPDPHFLQLQPNSDVDPLVPHPDITPSMTDIDSKQTEPDPGASALETSPKDVDSLIPDPDLTILVPDPDVTPTVADPGATQLVQDATPLVSDLEFIQSVPYPDHTPLLPEPSITPPVPEPGATQLEPDTGATSIVYDTDFTQIVPDLDVTLPVDVSGHTPIVPVPAVSQLMSKLDRTILVPDPNIMPLKSYRRSPKSENELTSSMPDDTMTQWIDKGNIMSVSDYDISVREPMSSITTAEAIYDATMQAKEMTKPALDHDIPISDPSRDSTPISDYVISTPSPNYDMTTSEPEHQQGIKQPDSIDTSYSLFTCKIFSYINDSTNLHVGDKYRVPPNKDFYIVIAHLWLRHVTILIFIMLSIGFWINSVPRKNKHSQRKVPLDIRLTHIASDKRKKLKFLLTRF